jgi:hypothetical protein
VSFRGFVSRDFGEDEVGEICGLAVFGRRRGIAAVENWVVEGRRIEAIEGREIRGIDIVAL